MQLPREALLEMYSKRWFFTNQNGEIGLDRWLKIVQKKTRQLSKTAGGFSVRNPTREPEILIAKPIR